MLQTSDGPITVIAHFSINCEEVKSVLYRYSISDSYSTGTEEAAVNTQTRWIFKAQEAVLDSEEIMDCAGVRGEVNIGIRYNSCMASAH